MILYSIPALITMMVQNQNKWWGIFAILSIIVKIVILVKDISYFTMYLSQKQFDGIDMKMRPVKKKLEAEGE
jgi:hypothetical protein